MVHDGHIDDSNFNPTSSLTISHRPAALLSKHDFKLQKNLPSASLLGHHPRYLPPVLCRID